MAERLGSTVDGIVLGCGDKLQVFRVGTLQAAHERDAKTGGQVGAFAIGFLSAAPAGIAKNIDVGRPWSESEVLPPVVLPQGLMMLGAGFVGNDFRRAGDQLDVESGGHADGLGKDGRAPGASHAVQAFVPPIISRDIEPWNGRRLVEHLRDLFRQSHLRDEKAGAFFGGKVLVQISFIDLRVVQSFWRTRVCFHGFCLNA